jgi:hypothetical protein
MELAPDIAEKTTGLFPLFGVVMVDLIIYPFDPAVKAPVQRWCVSWQVVHSTTKASLLVV